MPNSFFHFTQHTLLSLSVGALSPASLPRIPNQTPFSSTSLTTVGSPVGTDGVSLNFSVGDNALQSEKMLRLSIRRTKPIRSIHGLEISDSVQVIVGTLIGGSLHFISNLESHTLRFLLFRMIRQGLCFRALFRV